MDIYCKKNDKWEEIDWDWGTDIVCPICGEEFEIDYDIDYDENVAGPWSLDSEHEVD